MYKRLAEEWGEGPGGPEEEEWDGGPWGLVDLLSVNGLVCWSPMSSVLVCLFAHGFFDSDSTVFFCVSSVFLCVSVCSVRR